MSRCQAARTCYQDCQCSLGFVCVPVDFKHGASNGFAFINLLSPHQSIFEDVLFSTTGRARMSSCLRNCTCRHRARRCCSSAVQPFDVRFQGAFQLPTRCFVPASSRRARHLDEKVGNSTSLRIALNRVPSAGWATGATLPASTSSTYGRRPGQPSSLSLARRVCVQSPTSRVFFPRVRLHGHPEVCNCPWLLLWSRGGRRDCAAGGHRSFCDPVCSQSAPCILIFSPKRCL